MRSILILSILLLLAPLLAAQELAYPEGSAVPRYLTSAEAEWMAANPWGNTQLVSAPPTGPVHCVAEYEPMDGIIIAWESSTSWKDILAQMAAAITTTGNADLYCVVDDTSEISLATSSIAAQGANMGRVHFPVRATDTIWIRDYGPRYIFQGDVRAIVDHTYNRPRPNDNNFSSFFSGYISHPIYEHPLTHGGGNFHLDAVGGGYMTRLISNENQSYSEPQIWDIFHNYQNLDVTLFTPFPTNIDSTQHIDMWMQVYGDHQVMISDWPAQSGSTQDNICDAAAVEMAAKGFTVTRIPAQHTSGSSATHYTYTNVVICNDLVLVPRYSNSAITQYNAPALAAWQAALPGKTVVQIDCQAIVTAAGVMHCIMMHVPKHRGGVNPTAYMVTPNGGEILAPGTSAHIEWIADDDIAATAAALEYSTDGGSSWIPIASGLNPAGSYNWTVPNTRTNTAMLRVVVSDASANTGSDTSDLSFAIASGNQAAFTHYGSGKEGSLGIPSITLSANPVLGSSVTLQVSDAVQNSTAKLIRGAASALTPFDGAVALVNYDTVMNVAINGSGVGTMNASVPSAPALVGRSFYWQLWVPNDPGAAGAGWACSNGLRTQLGF
jgi:agmatine deiminase